MMKRALYRVGYWAFWGSLYSAATALSVTAFLAIGPLMSLFFEASEAPITWRILEFFYFGLPIALLIAGACALVAVVPAALTGVIQAILERRGESKRSDEVWIYSGAAIFSALPFLYLQYDPLDGFNRKEWHWDALDLVLAAVFAVMGLFCSWLILERDQRK